MPDGQPPRNVYRLLQAAFGPMLAVADDALPETRLEAVAASRRRLRRTAELGQSSYMRGLEDRQLWALGFVIGRAVSANAGEEATIAVADLEAAVLNATGRSLRISRSLGMVRRELVVLHGKGDKRRAGLGRSAIEVREEVVERMGRRRARHRRMREHERVHQHGRLNDHCALESTADYLAASVQAAEILNEVAEAQDDRRDPGFFSRETDRMLWLMGERAPVATSLREYELAHPEHPMAKLMLDNGLGPADAMVLRLLFHDRLVSYDRKLGLPIAALLRRTGQRHPARFVRGCDLMSPDGPWVAAGLIRHLGKDPNERMIERLVTLTDETFEALCGGLLLGTHVTGTSRREDDPRERWRQREDRDTPWRVIAEPDERPLVLPSEETDRLDRAIAGAPLRAKVARELGYDKLLGYGLASVFLFEGEPGTGKTLAAHVVARHLGKPLVEIGAASLLDKWVGGTEKGIRNVFAAATQADAVLLIDEADSLLRSRRNACRSWEITQVNTLLRCVEEFEGAVVLTTNFVEALDEALARRISLHMKFPRPGPEERLAIWLALTEGRIGFEDDVRLDRVAHRHAMTGAQIKNAVLDLAVAAVQREDRTVGVRDVAVAVREAIRG